MVTRIGRPSKPTVATLIISAFGWLWKIWDGIDRENALQSWLNANHATTTGQFVEQILVWAPAFLVLGILFWYHDNRTRESAMQLASSGSSALGQTNSTEIERALRTAQGEPREERTKNLALMAKGQVLATYKADSEILAKIAPTVRAYRSVVDLRGRLAAFASEMEEIKPSGQLRDDVARIQAAGKKNSERFDSEFRLELISLTSDLKSKYGLLHESLTDVALTRDVFGPLGVQPFIEGLSYLAEQLQKQLADDASNLNI